ncbi:MAG TPA: tetratricopeptide repeat protein [Bryobacteraceae bacterium]|jgi:tetratricopeptide (TPR) repeat protein|nr:tetratricopeptide repeat protein [Bryobacteraceae bacterium]
MKSIFLLLGMTALVGAASLQTELQEAQHLSAAGQTAAAESLYQEVIAGTKVLTPGELSALALQFYYLSRYRDAEALYRQSLAAWDKLGPEAARDRALTALNLGTLLRTEGRFPEAEALLRGGLKQAEASTGPDSIDAGRAASGLAALYKAWGKLTEAESLAVRANTIFGRDLTGTATESLNNSRILASIYIEQGHFDRVEALLRPLLQGPEDRQTAGVYNDLASAALRQNQLAEAESLSLKSLELAQRMLPAGHPVRAAALNNLAQSCRFQGRFLEAEKYYREAIAVLEDSLGRQHPDTAKAVMNLGAFYHQRGREAGAEDLYRRVANIFESAYGPSDPLTLVARNELAEVLRAQGRFTESEKLGRPSLVSLETTLGPQDPRVIRALTNYARLLEETKRSKQAAALRAQIQGMAQGFRNPTP